MKGELKQRDGPRQVARVRGVPEVPGEVLIQATGFLGPWDAKLSGCPNYLSR